MRARSWLLGAVLLAVGVAGVMSVAGAAIAIGSGMTVSGEVTDPTKPVVYSFAGTAGNHVWIIMNDSEFWFESHLELYSPSGTELQDAVGGTSAIEDFVLPESGTYEIRCSDDGWNNPGAFHLTLLKRPGATTFSGDMDGGALTSGQAVNASFQQPSDLDLYTFTAEAEDKITLVMHDDEFWMSSRWQLYGPDGTLVTEAQGDTAAVDKLPLTQTGQYFLICRDIGSNDTGAYELTLTRYPIRPYLLTWRPPHEATNVPPNQRLFVRFSKAMWKAKVEANTHLRVAAPGARTEGDLPVTFDWRGTTVVYVVPAAPLAYNTSYQFRIAQAAQSGDRHQMAGDFVTNFTTSDSFIVSSTPEAGATDVASDTPVTINLRWPARQGSVEARLVVRQQGGAIVPGIVTWPTPFATLTFTPNAPWSPGETYTVRINSGTRLRDDRLITWPESFTFTTTASAPSLTLSAAAAATANGGAQVSVNLTTVANVQVQVLNVAGRPVAALPAQTLPKGVSTLLWSGRSASGTAVPPGQYLLQVTARTAGGAQARALASCAVKR